MTPEKLWDRRHAVLRARMAGATLQVIGDKIGRSKERVRQMAAKAEREIRMGSLPPSRKGTEWDGGALDALVAKARWAIARKGME